MKSNILYILFVIAVFAVLADSSNGCPCEKPVASFTVDPSVVCIDETVSFDASESDDPDGSDLTYSWDFGSGAYDITDDDTASPTCKYNTAGEKTITLTVTDNDDENDDCCPSNGCTDKDSDEISDTVTVVAVDKIQYNDPDTGYTDVSGTLYVNKGTTVTFKAIPDPPDASWPSGKPVWGGTSGASGTGETTNVTFNTLSSSTSDYKTVTAECGNTVTANVIVFNFEGVLTPDFFSGRSQTNYGLEELVSLTFTTNPTGVTAAQAGELEWSGTGSGTVSNAGNDGTADYDAKEIHGPAFLGLKVLSGPSKDDYKSYWRVVIKPTGTRMTRVDPNTVWHIQYVASAGIALYYWLDPTNVSFSNLTFGEDACNITNDSGCWVGAPGHTQNTFGGITGGDSTTGCRVIVVDEALSAINPWGSAGAYTWSIPTQYIDDTSGRNTFGSNQDQVHTTQANGDATQAKGGQSGSAALNDPTSGY